MSLSFSKAICIPGITLILCLALLVAPWVAPGALAWSNDPTVNTPISTASGGQWSPTIVSDGSGGAIITWDDNRIGMYSYDIYAQRVDSAGSTLWTTNGVPICTDLSRQFNPTIVSDGLGGVIITWHDERNGVRNLDIYAQRVDSSGSTMWTANGVAISTASGDQQNPTIVSDGSGGAIITWPDCRSGNWGIYAQRVDSSGTTQWTADGVAISTASRDQQVPTIASDGSGGAIITWQDLRNFATNNLDIYAQRVDSSGSTMWTADGVAISTDPGYQWGPRIVSDGSGGAIITWYDNRSGTNNDIYAQRVDSSGTTQWTADGVAISTASRDQQVPTIASDGSGGAIITWQDLRNFATDNYDIYAQRVDSSGSTKWTANGVAISTAAGHKYQPTIVSDGSGGAIITWRDDRSSSTIADIYAQRVDSSGVVQWTAHGVAISTASGNQKKPKIVGDGSAGAIITWYDYRSGTDNDIYAQKVNADGSLPIPPPTITSISPNQGNQGETLDVTITGTSFTGATSVGFGSGITVNSFTVDSPTQITANISIDAAATLGARDVSVNTPGGSHTLPGGFSVTQTDADGDGDGVPDTSDNCPTAFNPDQQDIDGDDVGDVCDSDTQDSSGVSGEDGSITLSDESGAITFDGTTAEPYQTVTIEEDAGGVGTIQVTTRGKNRVSNKFDLLSLGLLTGTVTKVTDFPDGISHQQLDNLTVTKAGTGEITPDGVTTVPDTEPYTQVTVTFGIVDDATFTVLVPADSDSDGVYDQFDINEDGDFEDLDELDNCPNTPNPDQADSDGDGIGDVCEEAPSPEGGCFIATAAYGSYLDSHVETLRDFRDSYMVNNPVGKALVSAYYEVSPPVADFIDDHPTLKSVVRVGLLPAVAMSTVAVSTTSVEKIAIVGSLALVSVALAVWLIRRRGKGAIS